MDPYFTGNGGYGAPPPPPHNSYPTGRGGYDGSAPRGRGGYDGAGRGGRRSASPERGMYRSDRGGGGPDRGRGMQGGYGGRGGRGGGSGGGGGGGGDEGWDRRGGYEGGRGEHRERGYGKHTPVSLSFYLPPSMLWFVLNAATASIRAIALARSPPGQWLGLDQRKR